MIHIVKDFYIEGDTFNIILKQKKVKEKEGKKGEAYFVDIGYYATIQQLLDALVRKRIYKSIEKATDLAQINNDIKEIHKDIDEFCQKLGKEVKAMLMKEKEIDKAKRGCSETGEKRTRKRKQETSAI